MGGTIFISVLYLEEAFSSDEVFWVWLMTSGGVFAAGAFVVEPIMFALAIANEVVDEELRPYKHRCCAMVSLGFKNSLLIRERKLLGGNKHRNPGHTVTPVSAPYSA